jgi:hypothetical protein
MAEKHTEATCIAFSEIHLDGARWSFTIRQGVTQEDIDALLDKILYTAEAAAKRGFRFPGAPRAEEETHPPRPAKSDSTHHDGAGMGADDNPARVGRFKVAGTKDNPVVELYSANARLKFPILKTPFSILSDVVHQGYPDLDLTALSDCGQEGKVNWEVSWVASPKNPKWRDLVAVTIPKLGPPAEPIGNEEPQDG